MSEKNDRVESLLPYAKRTHVGWRMACPFCADLGHSDKKTSLQVLGDGRWWCYRGDEHPEVRKGKLPEAPDPGFTARAVIQHIQDPTTPKTFLPPPFFVPLAGDTSETLAPARAYLRSRNISEHVVEKQGIGACYDGKWAGRIIVPMRLADEGPWYGWVGRLWGKPKRNAQGLARLKYLYPPGMERERLVYNGHVMMEATAEPAMLVEGAFDTFPFLDRAFAVLGSVGQTHIAKIVYHLKRPLAVVLDGDAWRKGDALAMELRLLAAPYLVGSVRLPAKKDPDEVPREALLNAVRQCVGEPAPVRLAK